MNYRTAKNIFVVLKHTMIPSSPTDLIYTCVTAASPRVNAYGNTMEGMSFRFSLFYCRRVVIHNSDAHLRSRRRRKVAAFPSAHIRTHRNGSSWQFVIRVRAPFNVAINSLTWNFCIILRTLRASYKYYSFKSEWCEKKKSLGSVDESTYRFRN